VFFFVSLFFFSSRRRHTRSDRDWSSDVCSSDLLDVPVQHGAIRRDAELVGLAMDGEPFVAGELAVGDRGARGGREDFCAAARERSEERRVGKEGRGRGGGEGCRKARQDERVRWE